MVPINQNLEIYNFEFPDHLTNFVYRFDEGRHPSGNARTLIKSNGTDTPPGSDSLIT